MFYRFQEVNIRLVNNSSPLHRLSQILGLDELTSLLQIIPLEENEKFIGVIGVAEQLSPSGTVGLPGGTVRIKEWLPLGIVLDFMPNN